MEISKEKVAAYVQAIISILIILCTFLPFISAKEEDYSMSISLCLSLLTLDGAEDKYKIYGYLFIVYFMLHVVNIIIQAHKSCRLFSAFMSAGGIIAFIVLHTYLDDEKAFEVFEYSVGFYFVIILLVANLILPSLIMLSTITTSSNSVSGDTGNKVEDIEALKARIQELQSKNNE